MENNFDLKKVFGIAPALICVASTDGYFKYLNPEWEKVLGYSIEELLSRPLFDFIHPDDHEPTKAEIERQLEGNATLNFENRYRCKDDSYKVVQWSAVPAEGEKLLAVGIDITARKLAEEALRESEERYSLLTQNSQTGIYIHVDGILNFVNNHFAEMLGYEPEEMIGRLYWDFVHPEDRKMVKAISLARARGEEALPEYEFRHRSKDGGIVWVHNLPIIIQYQGRTANMGNLIQINDRKKTEEALRESEEQFRQFFEHLTIGVAVYEAVNDGEDFVFIDMNPAGQELSKISIDEIRGERLTQVFPGVRDLGLFEALQNTWRTGRPNRVPFREYKDKRITQWVENRVFLLPSNRVVAIYDDRTELIRLEKQLQQAQKMESIGNLAGGIAHDFNNLLSSIIGFTELALDEVDDHPEIEDDLREVYIAGKRAKELVSQILAFARQSDEVIKPVCISPIAKEVLKLIRSSTPSTIEIEQQINSNSIILGDTVQIHQLIMNLCSNAVYAMEKDGGLLTVALTDIAASEEITVFGKTLTTGNYIKLTVSDTGFGIPDENIPSIFEPYFTTKPLGEGTGMGLAMVYGIIENFGGGINVQSKVSEGTTFTVYLPVNEKMMEEPQYKTDSLPVPEGKETILFIDDEASIAKMGKRMLEGLGYHTFAMMDSAAALEQFRLNPGFFDLVITDMTMPRMTGDELAIELMAIRRDIPVILCTGYSKKITDEAASKMGIRALVYKPIVKADFAKTIRKVLDEAEGLS